MRQRLRPYVLLGLLSVMAAEPALAQYRSPPVYPYRAPTSTDQLDQLARRIDSDLRFQIISRQDGGWLRTEAERLRRVTFQYGNDGISGWERDSLARQVARLRDDVLAAEQHRFGRSVIAPRTSPYNPAYNDGDDRYGGTAPRQYDRDYDRDYDRPDDRDGQWDDDRGYGGGGYDGRRYDGGAYPDDRAAPVRPDRYEDPSRFGSGPGGGYPDELQVGDRAPVNLGLLPPQYEGRYRDGAGVYYRYWNGTIYQIDRRTDVIRWIGRLAH